MAVDASGPPSTEQRRGSGTWRATALTGVVVLVLVTVHMVANHFVVKEVGGLRTYHQVLEYIGNPVILILEELFLVAVTWHAMLGLRSVLFDLGLADGWRRRVSRGLAALGVLTLAYGSFLVFTLASRA
jgi:succinate dehydrogenase hydrophobic anchor subunit